VKLVQSAIIVIAAIAVLVTNYFPDVHATCAVGPNGAAICAGLSQANNITKSNSVANGAHGGTPDVIITLGCAVNDIRYGEYSNTCYHPSTLYVKLGTRVTWQNDDTWQHSVTYGNPWQALSTGYFFDSNTIDSGQSFSYRFNYLGTYPYYDALNWWETGLVIVKK
jgi:plastocyanin